ncbi:MAG: uroporphyrinogen-III synthase, partial [Selenomonadaceae bacterium]|nr:uroporphyrinogen-III synthase [Selenomonadaceae bacterium]
WQQLATATDTVVFLMGVANLPKITARLMENGRSGDTPVAIIRWGTKAQQQVWTSTVAGAADLVKSESIKPPCIFLVGNVVKLREKLAWFDNPKLKPLFGKRVLVTRARAQASLLAEKLETLGAACTEAPAIRIQPPADGFGALDEAVGKIDSFNWLIFTSANGVNYFFDRLLAAGRDSRALGRAKICAIGSATAKALQGYGIIADVVPAEFRAEGILAALEGKVSTEDKVLLPRAAEARNVLPEELGRKGIDVTVVPAYETVAGEADGSEICRQLSEGEIDVITFTSSSTVKNLAKILGEGAAELINSVKTAAIGPVTAATCREQGIRVDIEAKEYTIDGLVDGLVEALS